MKWIQGAVLFLSFACALQTSTARADQSPEEPAPSAYWKIVEQSFEFGGNYRKFDYVEGNNLDSEKGNMPGVSLGYAIDFEKFFATGALTIISSHTTYNGSNQSGTIPVTSNTKTQLIEFEVDAGLPLTPPGPFEIRGYVGLGYHYWRRGDAGVTNGVSDYREDYTWLVLPVGVRFEQKFSDSFKIGVDAAVRLQTDGRLAVKLSEIGDYQDADLDLGSKLGYKIQLPIEFKVASAMSVIATPFYEYSAIGEGDKSPLRTSSGDYTGTDIHEPESRTKQTGGTLVFRYTL